MYLPLPDNLLDPVRFVDQRPYLVFVKILDRLTELLHLVDVRVHHLQDVVPVLREDGDPHVGVVMLKFCKPGFSNMLTVNFQMFKLVLEKAEEPEIKLPTSTMDDGKSKRIPEKTSISALLTMPKPLTVWTTINCGKF